MKNWINKACLFIILGFVYPALGQNTPERCGIDAIHQHKLQNDPLYRQAFEQTQANLRDIRERMQFAKSSDSALYIIPTVVHIFHNGGNGNIDESQVLDGMRILNEDYRKTNADTGSVQSVHKGVHADTQVEFRLARIDPDGNCTNGIVYHRTPYGDDSFPPNNLKALSSWDNDSYMNIYLVNNLGGLLGYSAFPANNQTELEDGNFMRSDAFGSIGTAIGAGPYNLGRTTTHEVGHYLDVLHTFQGGCFGFGDGCGDTPATLNPNYGCPSPFTSCGGSIPVQFENFMDYSNDACLLMFSEDQRDLRMHPALNDPSTRGQLVTAANYVATGVLDSVSPCAPQPDYIINRDVICAGQTIQFVDNHYNGQATSRTWEFPGGSPGTSTDSIVTVTYSTPGNYGFKLSVGNALGTNLKEFNDVIVVTGNTGIPADQWAVDFENLNQIGNEIQTLGWELGNNFEWYNVVSQQGNSCVRINGRSKENDYQYGFSNYQEEFIYLPPVDLSVQGPSTLHLYYAYAASSNSNDSEFRVQVSSNCGQSWVTRATVSGNTLRTASNTFATFIPTPNEWDELTVNLASFANVDDLRIRIRFVSEENGNNFYLDNIFLMDQTIGLSENGTFELSAYPNPAQSYITLRNGSMDANNISIRLTDLSGREVLVQKHQQWNAGEENRIDLPEGIASGLYVLTIESNLGNWTQKWIIE